jgi:1,4-alpha-glucan branching enzyme
VADYSIVVPPGEYQLLLDSDQEDFGGLGRIESHQNFALMNDVRDVECCNIIKVYLPCRTAMVIKRREPGS